MLGDAGPERYAQALDIAARAPNTDGLLVILAPQAMTAPTQIAEQVKESATRTRKPILTSWMGGAEVSSGRTLLHRAGIPTFPYPDTAAQVFEAMWRYTSLQRSLHETPQSFLEADEDGPDGKLFCSARDTRTPAGRSGRA